MKLRVLRRIQGWTPELVTLALWCSTLWGKTEGDIIPVIAVYDDPNFLLGFGSNYHLGNDGRTYRGRDIALTIGEQRKLRRLRRN